MPVRLVYFFGFLVITLLLTASLYLQFYAGVIPCPLCTLQRLTFGLLGILFLIGLLLPAKRLGRGIINVLTMLTALLGIFLAGRQIWLQHFPSSDSSECGVSLQYMMQVLPLNQVIAKIFSGSSECSIRGWEFLHFNMAEWALIWFLFFLFLSIRLFISKRG